MCGIFCLNSAKNITKKIIEVLHFLEYRGYDSAGIAFVNNNSLKVIKALGKVSNLEDKVKKQTDDGKIAIGHTRWATHGKVNLQNTHPISSTKIALVHNGIIENYKEIKNKLLKLNYKFYGDTDTEVILNLIQYYIDLKHNYFDAFNKAVDEITGNYAIACLFIEDNNKIYCAKNGSPLAIGLGEDENYVASDVNTLAYFVKKVVILEDGDIAIISKDNYQIFGKDHNEITRTEKIIDKKQRDNDLYGFPNYMLKEISEQPAILKNILDNTTSGKTIKDLDSLDWNNVNKISIVACGSSYNAGMVAKYWFESYAKIPVEIDFASEFRARNVVYDKKGLYIFISQSGETLDTLAALKEAKKQNVTTIGLINNLNSSIANLSDYLIPIEAETEVSVAATKSFTAQLMKLLDLVLMASKQKKLISQNSYTKLLSNFNSEIVNLSKILSINENITKISKAIIKAKSIIFIGRNYMYPICLEGALKLKELSYLPVFAIAAGELKHGSIALIDEDSLVIALAPKNNVYNKMISNIEEVKARGAQIVLLTDSKDNIDVEHLFSIPKCSEILAPLFYTIPLQLFAYQVALDLGKKCRQTKKFSKICNSRVNILISGFPQALTCSCNDKFLFSHHKGKVKP